MFGDKDALDLTFNELRAHEQAGNCPSLVFSPMMVEDGRRLLIGNLDLRHVATNKGNRVDKLTEKSKDSASFSIEALELFRLFPKAKDCLKLSTAVRMSATFPYFTPAVSLPTVPRRRVVDAGYYDNYGVGVAASWLFSQHNEYWIKKHASKIVLIQIRDSLSDPERSLEVVNKDDSGVLSRAIEGLSSPPEGLYTSVFASATFRNDGMLELLSKYFRAIDGDLASQRFDEAVAGRIKNLKGSELRGKIIALLQDRLKAQDKPTVTVREAVDKLLKPHIVDLQQRQEVVNVAINWLEVHLPTNPKSPAQLEHGQRYFTTVNFEFGGKAALSWYLSAADRKKIEDAFGPYTEGQPGPDIHGTIGALQNWWKFTRPNESPERN